MRSFAARRRWVRARPWVLTLALVAVVAACELRLARKQSLWVDEIFSLAMATGHSLEHPAAVARPAEGDYVESERPVAAAELRKYLSHDNDSLRRVVRAVFLSDTSPPLYYLGLGIWTRILGVTDLDVRAFSIGWAVLCLPLVVAIGARLGGWKVAWVSAVLWASAPLAVYYSTEARMYSMVWFFLLAAAWLQCRGAGRWGWGRRLLWILASAGGLLTHYFFLFPWSALVAWALLRPEGEGRLAVVGRAAAVVAAIMPWYWHLPASLANWRVTGGWLEMVPAGFDRGAAIGRLFMQFFSGDGHWLWWENPLAEKVALGALALAAVLACRHGRVLFSARRPLVWLWLVAAVAGPVVFDLLRRTYTVDVPRYAISGLPAACLLGGLLLGNLHRPWRLGLVACVVGAWSFQWANIARNGARNDQPYWAIAGYLKQSARPDDIILVHSIPSGALTVARYVDTPAPLLPWVGQLGRREVPASLRNVLTDRRRIFALNVHAVGEPAPQIEWLRTTARIAEEKRFGAATLTVFDLSVAK